MASRQFRSDDTSIWTDRFGVGSDGDYSPSTGTDNVIDSACTGTSGTTSLSATNVSFAIGQLILIHQTQGTGAGNWELNKIGNYSAGTITTSYSLINTYGTGAQVLVMSQLSSGNIAGGVTITGKAWNGTVGGIYAKFCNGTFTIAGALTLTGKGFRGIANTSDNTEYGYQGEGYSGVGGHSSSPNGNAGSGGGRRSGGGGGANGLAGSNGLAGNAGDYHGTGGSQVGDASLTSIFLGGAGGSGGSYSGSDTGNRGGLGGTGGGIVLIIAKSIIATTSSIIAGGNNGNNSSGSDGGGGGAGAGGSILLKAQILTLGSNLFSALSATGGLGDGPGTGGASSVGRIHADYSKSISGTTNPTIDSTLDISLADAASFMMMF
jgi:large repetitive protein